MECNKDEAKRAMDIAERKVTEKDYTGAKKFANKAQNLYPDLDGLKQLLMTVDVYISGDKKINGEADWYGVIGVAPSADDEEVRKQYRKLALMLHPDKNKCNGAEGAFKLVSEAWSILSDKDRRMSYNTKRQVKEPKQRFTTRPSGVPPHPPGSKGYQNVRNPVAPRSSAGSKPARMDRSRMASPPFVSSVQKETTTFWTMCNLCQTQYEYLRVYLNQTLLCPHCRQGFVAAEKTPPPSVPNPVNLSSNQHQHRSSKNQAPTKNSNATFSGREPTPSVSHGFRWDSSSRTADFNNRNATNQAAANVIQQAQDRLRRGFVESQERNAARGFTNSDLRNFKKVKTDDIRMFGSSAGNWSNPSEMLNTIGTRHPYIQGVVLPSEITKALVNKAQTDILKRLPKVVEKIEEDVKVIEKEKKSMKATSKVTEVEKSSEPVDKILHDSDAEKNNEVNVMVVPDSDFHNFDLDRSETAFEGNQIWAAYDDDDGMPRFYARIQRVISLNPFQLRITWLSSKTCSEFGPLDWLGCGFLKTCGDFRTGRYETTDTLNTFSHKVEFTKGPKGLLHILPKKGQVWAMYRNWSSDWDKNTTPDEVIHKYDMVEVLDDYTQDLKTITVILLLKAEGFRSVFRRSTDDKDVRKIQKEEMFRFSHQVPHYILTGQEAENAVQGYLELDPAATPCELISENVEVKDSSQKSSPVEENGSEDSS